tara:strand:- start:2017 stop:2868 length:852 start_codon:yes stop_codon:yes gene_type:complete
MTEHSLSFANEQLSVAGILLRLTERGFDFFQKDGMFLKALEFCPRNQKARQDLLKVISPYKGDKTLVHLATETPSDDEADNVPPQDEPQWHHTEQHQEQWQENQPQNTHQNTQITPQAPLNQNSTTDNTEKREFIGHHIYGGKAALYFSLDKTKAEHHTIRVEGAPVGAQAKTYLWDKKMALQITRGDLPTVAAVFFGLLPECELSNYGADNTKRLMVKNQGKNFFLNMSGKGYSQIAVPISPSDVYEIRALVLRQLLASTPEIGIEGVLVNLKCHAAMLKIQ